MRDEYLEADEAGKKLLEKRYGKNVIIKAIEMKSSKWLNTNTKQCPSCRANVQKVDGCNQMCCARCKQNFCWRCFSVLSKEDPYQHFHNRSSPCYNNCLKVLRKTKRFECHSTGDLHSRRQFGEISCPKEEEICHRATNLPKSERVT
ncbi:hypothetical protein XELAEV_18021473mg [Xenopus laevis]|uniref:RING-type domain-containing protein n=1 Tax=Xenopus laevis TaxID=8355 RepID=A0A974DAF8_XENLA|nr:hypothetical protein XELAEV_18021473mg [Xenopus laevis]